MYFHFFFILFYFYLFIFFYFKLKDHLEQSENGTVMLTDIQKKVKGKYSRAEIGRGLRKVFHDLLSKPTRNKEFWAKVTTKYFGVSWKQTDVDSVASFKSQECSHNSENIHFHITKREEPSSKILLTKSDDKDPSAVLKLVTNNEAACNTLLQNLGLNEKKK